MVVTRNRSTMTGQSCEVFPFCSENERPASGGEGGREADAVKRQGGWHERGRERESEKHKSVAHFCHSRN